MTEEEFETLTDKLQGKIKYLYFHLMGEPTLHPLLPKFIDSAKEKGFVPMLTTNGSLLGEKGGSLLDHLPYKISISLHAPESNPRFADESYLDNCITFAKNAAKRGCFVALRLWNLGSDADNSDILRRLHEKFPGLWRPVRGGTSEALTEGIFLEWGERFDWPDGSLPEGDENAELFCYALRNHAGILVDGTVVPCCLDADGAMPLGNLFEEELDGILSSPRALAIFEGFSRRRAVEPLCRKCGYAKRFCIKK
jgi:MoaA/NifB/PqqE/SkfB family radical SAM enzyme